MTMSKVFRRRTPGAQVVHVETMDRVEMDFDDPADPAVLDADLATLGTATDEALRALGIDVPACPR